MSSLDSDHQKCRVDWRFERIHSRQQYRTPALGRSLSKHAQPAHSTHRHLHHPSFLPGQFESSHPLRITVFSFLTCQEITQNPERVKRWTGLRQDSGDPLSFVLHVKKTYENLGINHREKLIVFSDSLDVEKAINIQEQCNQLGFERGVVVFIVQRE